MLDYDAVRNWRFPEIEQTYDREFAMHYGLSVGIGADPMDERQLRFVASDDDALPAVLPTMSTVVGYPGFWIADPRTGIDASLAVHGEEHLALHGPLPAEGTLVAHHRVTAVIDKGEGRGALVEYVKELRDKASGALLASVTHTTFCRGDGGFARGVEHGDRLTAPALPPSPSAYMDAVTLPTVPQQALLYRLCADRNPLHWDPRVAQAAGFPRPILHGLCTFAVAAHAIVAAACAYDADRLRAFGARFTSPVFPGETLRTEIARAGSTLAFRTLAVERERIVLDRGYAEVSGS